ncbi:MAG TPA: response regulator transcription factor [Puia sp.]|nr:response regulator transcription factor [Puia sp.]
MSKDINVAIFEDNYLLRDGYFQLINGTPGFSCVGAFDSATDLEFKLRRCQPDVVLMDIDMPVLNGIEAVKLIKARFAGIHVIMQTVFEDEDKIFHAILAGAEGYILKKSPPARMLEAIAEVYNGGAPMTPSVASKTLKLFRSGVRPLPAVKDQGLTDRQKEILECIVSGMSYKLIADKLVVSVDTVRYHVKNIYQILHVHSRFELLNKQKR